MPVPSGILIRSTFWVAWHCYPSLLQHRKPETDGQTLLCNMTGNRVPIKPRRGPWPCNAVLAVKEQLCIPPSKVSLVRFSSGDLWLAGSEDHIILSDRDFPSHGSSSL